MHTSELVCAATEAITAYEDAALTYAEFARRELQLEADRPGKKWGAVARLMQEENPFTHRPHSASSAESMAELDPLYRAELALQHDVVLRKNQSFAYATSARLRAELAIASLRAQAPVAEAGL
jgi:hypothetical protein